HSVCGTPPGHEKSHLLREDCLTCWVAESIEERDDAAVGPSARCSLRHAFRIVRKRIPGARRLREPNLILAEHGRDRDLIFTLEEELGADGEEVERAYGQAPIERGFGCRFVYMVGLGLPLAGEFYRLLLGNDVGADQAPLTHLQIIEV